MRKPSILVVAAVTFGVSMLMSIEMVSAHHAFAAEFDALQPVTLKGTITKMEWVNPHAWLHIQVKNPDGSVASWALEFGSPNALYKRGWRKDKLPVGAEVTAKAFRAKNGSTTAHAEKVLMPDGIELFNASSGTGAPYQQ